MYRVAEQGLELAAQIGAAWLFQLHHRGVGRAPGQRFRRQGAGAGEQVQHPASAQLELEPVEQGFAQSVAGWAKIATLVDKLKLFAAVFAADNAHGTAAEAISLRFHRTPRPGPVGQC